MKQKNTNPSQKLDKETIRRKNLNILFKLNDQTAEKVAKEIGIGEKTIRNYLNGRTQSMQQRIWDLILDHLNIPSISLLESEHVQMDELASIYEHIQHLDERDIRDLSKFIQSLISSHDS